MMGLTAKQRALFDFIAGCLRENGIAPTFEEMRVTLGRKSKSCVAQNLDCLEERGYIRRLPHRARAIEIIERRPDATWPVWLNDEIFALVDRYADQQRIQIGTAVNELLRSALEAA